MVRHGGIDLAGQLDEFCLEVHLSGFPGKIKRIHRDAVPSQAGTGIKRLKSKRFGGGGFNHFPDVDAHSQAEQLEFIYQGNIDATVDILQQFGHLRGRRTGDGDGAIKDGTIKRGCNF